ncbi:MAG: hypothetical protein C4331_05175 [Meiothermus sp.]
MYEQDLPVLLTVVELRRLVGRERMGRDVAYRLARKYGTRLGKRWLLPRAVAVAIIQGRLRLEADDNGKNPAGDGG